MPPVDHQLRALEKKLGIVLPAGMFAYFQQRPKLEYLEEPLLAGVVALETLHADVPPRVLPVFSTRCGNMLGLYYARDGRPPFVVGFDHEESILFPLSTDADTLFRDPDRFSHDHPENNGDYPPKDWRACEGMLIDPQAVVAELELLKPFCFHYRALEGCDSTVFGPLLSRFGASDPRARLIAQSFTDVRSLHDRRRWIKLSEDLETGGAPREAIQALENCLTLHCIYPYYGEPDKKRETVSGSKDLEVLKRMLPLVNEYSDAFDRTAILHQLSIARDFARGE